MSLLAYAARHKEHDYSKRPALTTMNIIATEDIELLLALHHGQTDAVSNIGEKQRHKMISMGFIRYSRNGYLITELGERMAKSLEAAIS